ncbi:MAG TPA: hypothetical protein PKA02_00630 [Candidatus Saccharibacteria bacterium]|nr:hypothetical protein [Candidatus Saccharibacteria bacterium]
MPRIGESLQPPTLEPDWFTLFRIPKRFFVLSHDERRQFIEAHPGIEPKHPNSHRHEVLTRDDVERARRRSPILQARGTAALARQLVHEGPVRTKQPLQLKVKDIDWAPAGLHKDRAKMVVALDDPQGRLAEEAGVMFDALCRLGDVQIEHNASPDPGLVIARSSLEHASAEALAFLSERVADTVTLGPVSSVYQR